jgi:hypothetical protein
MNDDRFDWLRKRHTPPVDERAPRDLLEAARPERARPRISRRDGMDVAIFDNGVIRVSHARSARPFWPS